MNLPLVPTVSLDLTGETDWLMQLTVCSSNLVQEAAWVMAPLGLGGTTDGSLIISMGVSWSPVQH